MAKTLKYDKAKYLILNAIAQEALVPGDRLPSERDMMARLGISQISFRRALEELETQGIVKRIERNGTFLCSSLANAEPADRVLWLELFDRGRSPKGTMHPKTFASRLRERGLGVRNCPVNKPGPELLSSAQSSAGVVVTGEVTSEWIHFLKILKPKPVLILGDYPCNNEFPALRLDHEGMARETVKAFARRGAKHIGFINAIASYHPSAKMLAGYRAGLEECDLPFHEEDILIPDRDCESEQVAAYLRKYGNDLDALLVERYPYGAVLAAKWTGDCPKSMPLAVLDVDWSQRRDCRFPPGTLLATCGEDIGERLAEELFARILNPANTADVKLDTTILSTSYKQGEPSV